MSHNFCLNKKHGGKNLVVSNMVQNVPANNVFKEFTGNTSQRDWPVVFSQTSGPG